jgi:hypothetical protein
MSKVAQWSGFVCACLTVATAFLGVTIVNRPPSWLHVMTGWGGVLATIAGMVCVASAVLGWAKKTLKPE